MGSKEALLDKEFDLPVYDFLQLQHSRLAERAWQSQGLLLLLLRLLLDEDGLQVLRTVTACCAHPKNQLLSQPPILEALRQGLAHKDSVIRLRFMEVVLEAATHHLHELQGEVDMALAFYREADVLEKLGSAEIIGKMGDSPETARLLLAHPVWAEI